MSSFHNNAAFVIEDNILKGEVVPYHEEHRSLGDFILSRLEDFPDLVGQIDTVTGEEYTYRTMRERSVRCALWLQSHGLCPRDVVAICNNDHLDYSIAFFAIQYLGAVSTSWDITLKEDDYLHRMKLTKPKMAFTTEYLAPVLAKAAERAELDIKIIVSGRTPTFVEFGSIFANPRTEEVEKFRCTSIECSDETAIIVFSSGTTGLPKGVALSNKGLMMLAHQVESLRMSGNVCLTYCSTDWITWSECVLMHILLKMPRLISTSFEVNSLCAIIEKYKVTWINALPSMLNNLLKFDFMGKYDLSSLTHIFYTGEPLSIKSYRALEKIFPGVHIISGYGMTESCAFISVQQPLKSQPCSCGHIMKNAQLKVVDPDTGRTLGVNQRGELLLKFTCMMNFYLDDPVATREAIDEDGWLHSGDLGYYNEEGEIFMVNRLKDIIRLVDYDVSPSEIESVIWSHPGVKEVAVVGQPRPQESDVLIAFVVRADDSSNTAKQVTEKEIIDLVAARLPESYWLRAGVKFIDKIPKTPSNKIRRTALRELARLDWLKVNNEKDD